jgi:hypothetical protein
MTRNMYSNLKVLTVIHVHITNTFCDSAYLLALIFIYCKKKKKKLYYITVPHYFLLH